MKEITPKNELGGYCKSSNLFIRNTGKPDPDGILSEVIFGPVDPFRCSCGFLRSKALDAGKLCTKCNVLCESNNLRLTTFGRIKFILPIIKTTKKNQLIKLLGRDQKQLLNPIQADAHSVLSRYIAIKKDESEIKVITDLNNIPTDFIPIPFRITGIYSLIFVLKYCYNIIGLKLLKPVFEENWIIDEIKVLPPEIRPVFRDPKKPNQLIRVKVNDFYISILNLNKRNEILSPAINTDEEHWNNLITYNIQNGIFDEEIVESMAMEYDRISALYQYYSDEIYMWSYTTLSGKEGLIRSSILSRTIEFSARTVTTTNPALLPYEIQVSRKILYKLWMPYFLNWVCTISKKMSYDDAFYRIAVMEYEDNKELFLEFLEWFNKKEK